jgi:hypothetical protein
VDGGLTLRRDPVHYLLHTFLLSRLMGRVCGSVENHHQLVVRHGDTLRLFSFLPSAHVKRKHHLGCIRLLGFQSNLRCVVSTCCKPAHNSRPAETLLVPLRDSDLLSFRLVLSFAEDLVVELEIGRKGCFFFAVSVHT